MKYRLDLLMVEKGLTQTRSQAESYIRLGQVKVDGKIIKKPGYFAREDSEIEFGAKEQYVSRAALKLASVSQTLKIDFKRKTVLDVGSSTGGFTDYALQNGASIVVAVDVGTNQMHPRLRSDSRVKLYEKSDIRNMYIQGDVESERSGAKPEVRIQAQGSNKIYIPKKLDTAVIDVSFISITKVLPSVTRLVKKNGQIIAMLKPQFEAGKGQLNKGVVKNNAHRREILKQFELWCRENKLAILKKSDSSISGEKGNIERFYLLRSNQ